MEKGSHKIPNINGVISENNTSIISYCLLILRQSRLLPAGLMSIISNVAPEKINQWTFKNNFIHVDVNDIKSYEQSSAESLIMAVRAKVPIAETENCEVIIFRPQDGGDEHFCLVFGKTREIDNEFKNETLVRVHSQCITGDILDSLKCDCGQQLKQSIKIMAKADEGVLIYLAQEGRDIGLLNKLRAYSLQEIGMDTVEANQDLGFNDDERLYYPAKQMLSQLKINKVKLITNNPKKVEHLKKLGINSVAICSNDAINYPEDSFENMIKFGNENNFSFPYLSDKTQEVAKAYDAVCTPDFFGYNKNLELQYRGRMRELKKLIPVRTGESDLFQAMKQIAETGKGPKEQIPSAGCGIKWKFD